MIKKTVLSITLSSTLLFGAGIPVVDVISNTQALTQNIKEVAEWAEQAARWSDTVQQYQKELQAYETELLSKTGIRDSVQFMKDLNRLQEYSKAYGDDYLDLAKAFANPNTAMGQLARSLFDKYNVFDRCENDIYKNWEKESCENKLKREVTQMAMIETNNTKVTAIATNIDSLSKKLTQTQDIKESQDIANVINVELTQLQILSMKMDMLGKQNEAQEKAEEEQKQRHFESKMGKHIDYSNFDWSLGKK